MKQKTKQMPANNRWLANAGRRILGGGLILAKLVFLGLLFSSCEKDPPENDPCTCPVNEHLGMDEATCGGVGCECVEQVGTIAGTAIPIRKQAGISVADMAGAITAINAAYTAAIDEVDIGRTVEIVEVHIVNTATNDLEYNNDNIVIIKLSQISRAQNMFRGISTGSREPGWTWNETVAQGKALNGVKVVDVPKYTRERQRHRERTGICYHFSIALLCDMVHHI